jgi:ABC-2 type transport system permease protein
MSWILISKLLRDLRVSLPVIAILLFGFQFVWCKSTQQGLEVMQKMFSGGIDMNVVIGIFFKQETGRMVEKMIGGDKITIGQGLDTLSVGYVHPVLLTILSIWAVGRAAGAIAGELDKGTMELLLAQPIERWRIITSHLAIDCLTIPILCAALWLGTTVGCYTFGLIAMTAKDKQPIEPLRFVPAMENVAALLFALSGITMVFSAAGRSRARVLGIAVVLTLVQFVINLVGQTWPEIEFMRPWTVFYYYQPQALILGFDGPDASPVRNLATLSAVGLAGYVLSLLIFVRRDLPAPL